MPTLQTPEGKPVQVTPIDPDAVNAAFNAAMTDDTPDPQALPRRQPKAQADGDAAKPRTARQPKADKPRTAVKPPVKLDNEARFHGVQGLAQVGAGLLLMAGKATKNEAFTADAVTVASMADEIADACVQTAQADARFAAALDRVCAAGPYAALITVGVGLASQIARNHRPSLVIPGTKDPAELLRAQADAEARHEPAAA